MDNTAVVKVLNDQLATMLARQAALQTQITSEKQTYDRLVSEGAQLDSDVKQVQLTIQALGGTAVTAPAKPANPFEATSTVTMVEEGKSDERTE